MAYTASGTGAGGVVGSFFSVSVSGSSPTLPVPISGTVRPLHGNVIPGVCSPSSLPSVGTHTVAVSGGQYIASATVTVSGFADPPPVTTPGTPPSISAPATVKEGEMI